MGLFYEADAIADLESIIEYGVAQGLPNPEAYVRQLMGSIDTLIRHPKQGRRGRVVGTRELVIPGTSHIAVYTVDGGDLFVRRVLHGAQQWP